MIDLSQVFQLIGSIYVISKIASLLSEFFIILRGDVDIKKKYGDGCWALITGATDGIGKGFCQQLVKQNINMCLIVRSNEKAQQMIKELQSTNTKSQFKIIIADFSNSHQEQEQFQRIFDQVKDLDIGLLINNVGVAHTESIQNLSEQQIRELINVNCYPIVLISRYIIPLMLKRKNRSGIINLSSFAGCYPIPFNQTYSATKAFDDILSRALAIEYSHKIDIMSLRPLYVTTKMTNFKRSSEAINIDQCAIGCLQRLQYTYGTFGHWKHRLQGTFLGLLPESIRSKLIIKVLKKNQKVKKQQ